MMYKVW